MIWVQGCHLACTDCWNKHTWSFEKENLVSVDKLFEVIAATKGMRDRLDNSTLLKKQKINIIHGALDEVIKSEKLYAELSRINTDSSTLFEIIDSGHMSIWENTKELNNYIKVILIR